MSSTLKATALIVMVILAAFLAARAASAETPPPGPCHTVHACRVRIVHLERAVAWQQTEKLKLAREMVGKLTDWTCIHGGEGAWTDNTGNGYHGGLQMDWGFMRTYGRDMLRRHHGAGAEAWTAREQIIVAQRAFVQGRGYNPWPNTARACGLR